MPWPPMLLNDQLDLAKSKINAARTLIREGSTQRELDEAKELLIEAIEALGSAYRKVEFYWDRTG
jgi:hypothetical protein